MRRDLHPIAVVVALLVAVVIAALHVLRPTPLDAQVNFRDPIVCDQSVVISGNTAATAELVALTAAQSIKVCGFTISGAGATTVKLVRGTGTNCGTGTADLTGPFELGDNTSVSFGGGVGSVIRVTAANALCWTNSAAVQASGLLTYAKF